MNLFAELFAPRRAIFILLRRQEAPKSRCTRRVPPPPPPARSAMFYDPHVLIKKCSVGTFFRIGTEVYEK